jgi:tetratricopeptide (TPR) repeat protein
MITLSAIVMFLVVSLSSCGIKQQFKGRYFLSAEKYEQGVDNFRAELDENPNDPAANYFMGRFLLGAEKPEKAAEHFSRAVRYDPDNADYRFWLGVAHGEAGAVEEERKNYLAALELEPDYLMARTYLAHLQLKSGENEKALENYEKVLEKWPYSAQALYNRALVLGRLGRTPEEKLAWKLYLGAWPEGVLARHAADHLNSLGDFTYRNHVLGKRVVTLEKPAFEPLGAELKDGKSASLDLVGEILEQSPSLILHVITYQLNNEELARKRALTVKRHLSGSFDIDSDRIKASWFPAPEAIEIRDRTFEQPESINLFALEPE